MKPYRSLFEYAPASEELAQYVGKPNIYVSYTQIEKLGINPRSDYATPNGIYSYPFKDEYVNMVLYRKVPFAADAPWINVFTPKNPSRVKDLGGYDQSDFDRDEKVLRDIYFANRAMWEDGGWEKFVSSAVETAKSKREYRDAPVAITFWALTMKMANGRPNLWNGIFRQLGYEGFVDCGGGIIHPNEPYQAVFFNASFLKVLGRYRNKADYFQKLTPQQFGELSDLRQSTYKVMSFKQSNPAFFFTPAHYEIDKNGRQDYWEKVVMAEKLDARKYLTSAMWDDFQPSEKEDILETQGRYFRNPTVGKVLASFILKNPQDIKMVNKSLTLKNNYEDAVNDRLDSPGLVELINTLGAAGVLESDYGEGLEPSEWVEAR